MAEVNFTIKGLDRFERSLSVAPKKAAEELKDAMAISIAEVHREAIPRTPVDTGYLRRGYREKIRALRGILTNDVVYALYQHEGFFKHPRGGERHYLLNAVNAKTRDITYNFNKAIELTWTYVKRKSLI